MRQEGADPAKCSNSAHGLRYRADTHPSAAEPNSLLQDGTREQITNLRRADLLYSNIAIVRLASDALAPTRGIDMLVFSRLICETEGSCKRHSHRTGSLNVDKSDPVIYRRVCSAYQGAIRACGPVDRRGQDRHSHRPAGASVQAGPLFCAGDGLHRWRPRRLPRLRPWAGRVRSCWVCR